MALGHVHSFPSRTAQCLVSVLSLDPWAPELHNLFLSQIPLPIVQSQATSLNLELLTYATMQTLGLCPSRIVQWENSSLKPSAWPLEPLNYAVVFPRPTETTHCTVSRLNLSPWPPELHNYAIPKSVSQSITWFHLIQWLSWILLG